MLKEKEKREDFLLKRKKEREKIIEEESSKFELRTIKDLLLSESLPEEVFEELMAYEEKFSDIDEEFSKIFCKITLLRSALHFIHGYYNNRKIADSETVKLCNGFISGLYSIVMFDDVPDPTIEDLIYAEEAVALVVNLYEDLKKNNI